MTATLIAVRPIIQDGRTLDPGTVFTVDAEHASALLRSAHAATSPVQAASYGVLWPVPSDEGHRHRPVWPHGVDGFDS